MNLTELETFINNQMQEILSSLLKVKPEECGLDHRIDGHLYIDLNENAIITHKRNQSTLNYYGFFEYIDESAVTTMGDYVIYRADYDGSGRIQDAIDTYTEAQEEE